MRAWRGRLRSLIPGWRPIVAVLLLLSGTAVWEGLELPCRTGFAVSRASFERLLPVARPRDEVETPQNRWVGVYLVDRFHVDRRGGVFFRTARGMDMIDAISYGFAYRPNREGTPFGNAGYRLRKISGDWYRFRVSDDW